MRMDAAHHAKSAKRRTSTVSKGVSMIHYKCKDFGSQDMVYIESIRVTWNARDQQWEIDPNDLALADKRCGDCGSWNVEEYEGE